MNISELDNKIVSEQIQESMNSLDVYNKVYEREALDKAVAHREEITPVLIDHLKMLLDASKRMEDPRTVEYAVAN